MGPDPKGSGLQFPDSEPLKAAPPRTVRGRRTEWGEEGPVLHSWI